MSEFWALISPTDTAAVRGGETDTPSSVVRPTKRQEYSKDQDTQRSKGEQVLPQDGEGLAASGELEGRGRSHADSGGVSAGTQLWPACRGEVKAVRDRGPQVWGAALCG